MDTGCCEDVTYRAIGVKYLSITQARVRSTTQARVIHMKTLPP